MLVPGRVLNELVSFLLFFSIRQVMRTRYDQTHVLMVFKEITGRGYPKEGGPDRQLEICCFLLRGGVIERIMIFRS